MKNGIAKSLMTLAALAACSPAQGQVPPADANSPPPPPPERPRQEAPRVQVEEGFIEVTGTAQRDVPVDRATMIFAVETEGATAGAAVEDNATRMEAVMAALRATGTAGLTMETSGFDLQPRYGRSDPQSSTDRRILGYRAVNNVSVTADDVDAVGELIDAAVGAGANRVAGLSFQASDTEEVRLEVLQEAVGAARRQAQVMADALGLPLGPPLEVRGGAQQPSPRPMQFAMRAEMAVAATPVEAGDQTVTASVTIKYRLGPGERP